MSIPRLTYSFRYGRHSATQLLLALSVFACAFLCVHAAFAQSSGGSTYSILNFGDLRYGITAASGGHANIETATPSSTYINSTNPALWSDLRYVLVQASLSFDQYFVSSASNSQYQNVMKLQDFSVAFPYSAQYGGTLVFGIRPYSTVNYRSASSQVIPATDTDKITATTVFSGSGGLSEMVAGTSFRPIPQLAIGLSGVRYFGSINAQTDVTFASAALNPAVYRTNDFYVGYGAKMGLQTLLLDSTLRIGATAELGVSLTRTRNLISAYIDQGLEYVDTTARSEATVTIPPRFGFGASYRAGRVLLSAEATIQSWDNTVYPSSRPSNRIAVGIDRMSAESMNATGFDRWTFRAGAFTEQTYYNVRGVGIDQMGVSVGFGVPLTASNPLSSSTTIDVAFEIGQRGTTDLGLTKEVFGRLSFGLSLNELWFQRIRR